MHWIDFCIDQCNEDWDCGCVLLLSYGQEWAQGSGDDVKISKCVWECGLATGWSCGSGFERSWDEEGLIDRGR